MGLLDGVLGGSQPRSYPKPGLGDTALAGVVLALLVKAVRSRQAGQASGAAPTSPAQAPAGGGGLGGVLGGLLGGGGALGGGGLGGLIGSLGGAGSLGALIGQMQQNGFGGHAASWVGPGPNEPIAPNQLADALGPQAVDELQQKTGMPREQLLASLSHELPEAVNQVTPNGRLPTEDELHQIAQPA